MKHVNGMLKYEHNITQICALFSLDKLAEIRSVSEEMKGSLWKTIMFWLLSLFFSPNNFIFFRLSYILNKTINHCICATVLKSVKEIPEDWTI